MNFKNLHYQKNPLIIANVWDVPSTKIAEKLGFKAIGTSSSAIANLLGYDDGEEMTFSELEYFVKRNSLNTKLPLSVDMEFGYGKDPEKIIENIKKLNNLGVCGINIEDSNVHKKMRTLTNSQNFAELLFEINKGLQKEKVDIFINVRIDTFLLNIDSPIRETKKRIKLYQNNGADGIFIPCIEKESDIREITKYTNLPVNVMCMPNLPNFDILTEIGVKRISMGNFIFDKMYNQFEQLSKSILDKKSFNSIF